MFWSDIFKNGWGGKQLFYHSGISEKIPPNYTYFFIIRRTLDIVVSNFAKGTCYVLGVSPGTKRLDGGSGTDHRALYGSSSNQGLNHPSKLSHM